MNIETEVLIVGAGAAGCTLGYLLRQSGADVLAIEIRDASSKDKLCGGILGPDASHHLEEIHGKEALGELDLLWPRHLVFRALGRRDVQDSDFATIPRIRLDRWLLSRFLEEGGTVRDRIRIDAIDPSAHLATCTGEEELG